MVRTFPEGRSLAKWEDYLKNDLLAKPAIGDKVSCGKYDSA